MLVVFAGLPGTGKTTLARRLSESLGSVYLRIDAIEHAIRTADSPGHEVGDVGYRVGYAMAQASLCAGRIVVADSVNPVQESRDAWCAAASECGVKVVEIEVICSDPMEHRRRVERRVADIPGFVLPTWEAVTAREYHPWTRERLVVDTAGRAVEQCLSELIERLDGHPDCSVPLHYAARDDRADAVRELLAIGVDPSAADDDGWTPLHFAAQAQTPSVVTLLLDAGAAVDVQDSLGNTPLMRATFESKGRGEVIQLLRAAGADPWCANKSQVSPVLLARTIANYPVAQFYADLPA